MKKFLSLILLALLPIVASADIIEVDGIYYDILIKAKIATVTNGPSGYYKGTVNIPESFTYDGKEFIVTSIGDYAFYECESLTTVIIGNSVESIGKYAFGECGSLASVAIPNSVTSIGLAAFTTCTSLTSITIPNSVTSIGDYAFICCSGLTSITIPNSVTSISNYVFSNCESLTSVTIPGSVTSIGEWAFYECYNMTSVNIPNSVTSIGDYAFADCRSLAFVTIGNSVKSIGNRAFSCCNNLTSINIPESVTSIGECAFEVCESLTSINIPESVMSIRNNSFSGCSSLTSVTIPNSVESIGDGALWGCSGLTSVIIGNGVTIIGEVAFGNCPELADVYCYAEQVPSTYYNAFEDSYIEYATLYVPEAAIEQYKAKEPWSNFGKIVAINKNGGDDSNIIFADALVKEICVANWDTNGDGELSEKEAAAVTEIGRAFKGKYITSFNELRYFTGLNSIFPDAFSECSCLKSINIPNSVTSIGNSAFYGCISLNSVTIPNSVTNIQTYAFQNCKGLTSFIIGNSVTYISNTVFYGCNSLKKIIWLTTTPPTGYEYANLDGVINYVTNEQYTELNNKVVYPFLSSLFAVDGIIYVPVNPSERTCDAIDCIYDETSANTKIPLSVSYNGITMNVQRIQPYICYNNKYIDSLYCEYNGNIETYSFFGCTDIKNIVCNINGEIEQEAFKGLSNLMSLSLGSQLNFIGKEAFSGCTSLTEIVSKAVNPPSCGEFAFHEINVWSCKLIVPKGSMVSYREADQWKEFFFIEEDTGSDVIPDPEKKCAIPTISYKNGQLSFESETEGVEFKSSIRDTDINDYSVSVINLSATYTITVYATKDGYENSEVATGTLCWIDVAPETEGIVNEDAVTEVKAMPVLIQTQGGTISIQGAAEGTPIAVYDIEGKQYGSTIAEKDYATITTSLRPGSIAVVKIGEKAVKVAIK